ncbi:MAG: hypothetical protein P8Q31_02135 [Luminiphilus sp.]|jgi:hypothetical protein|nr:hypothetical protein [Luminiphilus sp.]MDG1460295.1 hypothetical protein [Luminiphilus sp.]
MGERTATHSEDSVGSEDFFEPLMGDLDDEMLNALDDSSIGICAPSLAEKRRRAEKRLETLRLREELGDFDFELYDD